MWFFNLLTESVSDGSSDGAGGNGKFLLILFLGIAAVVGMSYLNLRSQKKRQQEMQDRLRMIQPGNRVKTIGGICGTVVEVCLEENTFVLETGSETSGKSYIKFDMVAIYQTDAQKAPVEEAPMEGVVTEATPVDETIAEAVAVEELASEAEATPAEQAPMEEGVVEEAPASDAE